MTFLKAFLMLVISSTSVFAASDGSQHFADKRLEKIRRGDIEHRSKALFILDKAFTEHRIDYLAKISTNKFQNSRWFKKFQKYVKSKQINWNYKSERATQRFILNGNKNHVLSVDFDKKKDGKWYVIEAQVIKNGRQENLKGHGFTPGEISLDFWEVVNILSNKTGTHSGLTPFGELNKKFRGYKLDSSRNKSLQLKNIIIHKNNRIETMIFLTLKYYQVGHTEGSKFKSGWLIDDGGEMSTLYPLGKDIYVDFLLSRRNPNLALNKPNRDTAFVNVPWAAERGQSSQQNKVQKENRGKVYNRKSSGSASITGIRCKENIGQRFVNITFQLENAVPIDELIMNHGLVVDDNKLIVAGKNIPYTASCQMLNIQSIGSRNSEMTFKKYAINRYSFHPVRTSSSLFHVRLHYGFR